jgi:hypothetical protein
MAKEAIPYPDLLETPANDPRVSRAQFWRAAWLRDLAEYQALVTLREKEYTRKRPDLVTQMALTAALGHAGHELRECFRTLVDAGGLLFAWAPDQKGGAQ